jgi:hypothetical protein
MQLEDILRFRNAHSHDGKQSTLTIERVPHRVRDFVIVRDGETAVCAGFDEQVLADLIQTKVRREILQAWGLPLPAIEMDEFYFSAIEAAEREAEMAGAL